MKHNWLDRALAAGVFLYALVLYTLTMSPTVAFWDVGEFIAVGRYLEVPHPPGAPFFILLVHLFTMFMPDHLVAAAANFVSVLSSALTVLLTYLIILRLVREWKGDPTTWNWSERLSAYAGALIGALTFAVTDSFWFNAVEAEVYALSMLFTALTVWLILKWSEVIREEMAQVRLRSADTFGFTSSRYLILIAYLVGLAIGVHLLNLLTLFFVALIIYFTEFDRPDHTWKEQLKGILITGIFASVVFLFIYPGIIQGIPELMKSLGPLLFLLLTLIVLVGGLYYTHKNRKVLLNLAFLGLTMILLGYSSYALIYIRSQADPPIDENDPETIEAFISYLKREQYGETPLLKGHTYNNRLRQIDTQREAWFPRRWSPMPQHLREYAKYKSDWDFFLRYQLGHMYFRYFMWNFAGRASDVQDAGWILGFSEKETQQYLYRTPSERASRNAYYGLPLLLGLLGFAYHFKRDWRRALSVGALFFITGIGIVIYLNQPPLQPRERDYSYVGSFFAFSLWIGIGATGLLELTLDYLRQKGLQLRLQQIIGYGLAALVFLAIPFHMLLENYDDHDRSGRYVARDYAWNMLVSVEEQAIMFTNGDNDTFPLWYLQEVEKVRRDVRVANLSLLNTSWYIKQLKNQYSRTSKPVPMSLTDAQVDRMQITAWKPREITLPVNKKRLLSWEHMKWYRPDSARIMSPMRWTLKGRPYSRDLNVLWVADQAVLDILRTNAQRDWERPIYFAITVSPDGQLDLQHFFHLEGMAYRVVPIQHNEQMGRVIPDLMLDRLKKFRFTNLNNPHVYFDENIRRMVDNYRNLFAVTATALVREGRKEEAKKLLDTAMEKIPLDIIPADVYSLLTLADAYEQVGDTAQVKRLMQELETITLHRLKVVTDPRDMERAVQYVQLIQYKYLELGDFEAASAFSRKIAEILGDSTFYQTPEQFRELYGESPLDTTRR